MKKRLLIIMLVISLVFTICACSKAEEVSEKENYSILDSEDNEGPTKEDNGNKTEDDSKEKVPSPTLEEYLALREAIINGEDVELPQRFDLRDYNLVTPGKDQGNFMNCWVFGALGSVESNALVSGFGEYDFSEYQLAVLSETIPVKQDEAIDGEGYVCDDCKWYDHPGMSIYTVSTFMKGYAPALEEEHSYRNIKKELPEEAIDDAAFKVDNCFMVTPKTPELIKKLIIENGAVTIGANSEAWNYGGVAFCSDETYIEHYVTVVGWDDTYESMRFSSNPNKDGAWIIKNSWGTGWGAGGYLYLSYYDAVMNGTNVTISYTVTSKDSYDYQYQYDGGAGLGTVKDLTDVAIAFNAKDNETITGVKVFPRLVNGEFTPVNATVNVYKGIDSIDKTVNATPIYTMEKRIVYAGYQTLEFDEGVNINKNDKIFVTVTFDAPVYYADDASMKGKSYGMYGEVLRYHTVTHANPGETFVRVADDNSWHDRAADLETSNMCIKVMVRKGHDQEVIHRKWLVK